MSKNTGEYVKHITDNHWKSEYYTFIPGPLFNNLNITIDEELALIMCETHRQLGILEGLTTYLPDKNIIMNFMIMKEACYSANIDNKGLVFQEAILNINTLNTKNNLVANTKLALEYILENDVLPSQLDKIFALLQDGELSKPDIVHTTRKSQIFVFNVRTNLKRYNPTAPEHIENAMYDLNKYVGSIDSEDILIKSALAHYQFEMIHPYEKYNGIIGRILVYITLIKAGIKATPFLSLSEILFDNKSNYFGKLGSTQIGGGYLDWVKFFIRTIGFATQQSITQMDKYINVVNEDYKRIIDSGHSSKSVLIVYEYYKQFPSSGIKSASEYLSLSFNTVAKAVKTLIDIGLLQAEDNKQRHRNFQYRNVLEIFDK